MYLNVYVDRICWKLQHLIEKNEISLVDKQIQNRIIMSMNCKTVCHFLYNNNDT